MSDAHKKDDHGGGGGHSKKGHKKSHGHGGGGHGGEEHGEGAPEWLISFADNVMLQMGFFVILLALNMGPKGGGSGEGEAGGEPPAKDSFLDFAIAVRAGFNNPVDINSDDPNDAPLVKRLKERQGQIDEPGRDGNNDKVESVRPSGFSSMGGVVNFVDGSSVLSAGEVQAAQQIAQGIQGLDWVVQVRGHVSAAESVRDEKAGWRLSYERAYAVGAILVESGLDWAQIRLVACGTSEPLQEGRNYDLGALRGNQRVEIVVTNERAQIER